MNEVVIYNYIIKSYDVHSKQESQLFCHFLILLPTV